MNFWWILLVGINIVSYAMERMPPGKSKISKKPSVQIHSWSWELIKGETPIIIVESKEGQKFPIPKDAALYSETIKLLLTDSEIGYTIPFSSISKPYMEYLVAFFWALHKHKNLNNKAQLDAIEKTIKEVNPLYANLISMSPIDLLKIANYLDCKLLQQLIARTIAAQIIQKSAESYFLKPSSIAHKIFSSIEDNFGKQEAQYYIIEVARYYFLLTKQKKTTDFYPGIDYYFSLLKNTHYSALAKKSYGYSIQDYLDYKPYGDINLLETNIGRMFNLTGAEYFYVSQLVSLEGLKNIPHINMAKRLNFSGNLLRDLPSHIFDNFHQLESLSLRNNQLKQLDPYIFSQLHNLGGLDLSGNKLGQLDPHIFSQLYNLEALNLSHNPLSNISFQLFSHLKKLESLALSSCNLINLETNMFINLNNLQYLYLAYNQLSYIDPQTFAPLFNLKLLDLEQNKLNDENQIAIRNAYPNINIRF